MGLQSFLFYYFAIVIIATAALTVSRRNPIHSVMFLVPCFIHTAGLFLLLGAEFLAAIQVLVYTGAIMVLYLFVVFLLDLPSFRIKKITHQQTPLAVLAGLVLVVQIIVLTVVAVFPRPAAEVKAPYFLGNTEAVGASLYTTFLFPFELASLVLLVAIFGAVVLARRERGEELP
ncbi:MAG: NADH-quinone oxidoreductase subunit J [bacterium]|nr:MAG: NADH-quinone oxidoreductase subunit J [bacterium]